MNAKTSWPIAAGPAAFVLSIAAMVLSAALSLPADDAPRQERQLQVAIRQLAEQTSVAVESSSQELRPVMLREEPVMRYGDQTREIFGSALWVWMDGAVPVLLQKIEASDQITGMPRWTFCFSSLSAGPLKIGWPHRAPYQTQSVAFRTVAGAPTPSSNPQRRSLQMRAIVRGLSVYSDDGTKRYMRLLPKPLLEFEDPQRGVLGGAVFAFAWGTNPDVCLIVEAVAGPQGTPLWRYAPVRMTSAGIVVGDATGVLWTEEDHRQPGDYGSWGWYWIPRDPDLETP